jgi:hypothetical protein
MPVAIVVSTIVVGIGEPMDILIMLVSVVPIGVIIRYRRFFAVGIPLMHPPAVAVLIASDIGSVDSGFGAGNCRRHRDCARNGEERAQPERSMKLSHASPFNGQPHPTFRAVNNAAGSRWFPSSRRVALQPATPEQLEFCGPV